MSYITPAQLPGTAPALSVAMVESTTSTTTYAKFNSAATHPTISNDASQGYTRFSHWVCTADDTIWICSDATTGAARWENVSGNGVFDVSAYGAVGDGVANDYTAINAAATAMTTAGGGVLYFPPGKTYRITTTAHFLHLDQVSNWTMLMGQNSLVVLDNLDGSGNAIGHGLYVTGPCSNIKLLGVHIKYVQIPTTRDVWAPFYFLGLNVGTGDNSGLNGWVRGAWPNANENPTGISSGAVSGIVMRDCTSENSSSVFAAFVGVDGTDVQNFTGNTCWADGLYHLYFRRARVNGARLFNCGDDGVSCASYESDLANSDIENDFHGEGSTFDNVYLDGLYPSTGYPPSGSAVALGVRDIIFSNFIINGKYCGIRIQNGTHLTQDFPNLNLNFLASRRVIFKGHTISNFQQAIILASQESNLATDPKWWQADVLICDVVADNGQIPINIYGVGTGQLDGGLCSGFHFKNVKFQNSTSAFATINQPYNCIFEDIQFDGTITIYGSVPYSGDPDAVDGSGNALWADNLCSFLNLKAATIVFQGLKRCYVENPLSINAPVTGITFSSCGDVSFGTLQVIYYNRTATSYGVGVFIDPYCKRITGNIIDVDNDAGIGLALSIGSTVNNFINLVKTRTGQNTFFYNVADLKYSQSKQSQISRIDWINVPAMPGWDSIVFPTDPTHLFGDSDGDLYLYTLASTARYGTALTANRVLTIHEDSASIGEQAVVTRLASCTGAFTLTVKGQGVATPAVAEQLAQGSFIVTGGASGDTFSSVKVNGIEILGAAVGWSTANSYVATLIAQQINTGTATHNYSANSFRTMVVITAANGTGATPNGYVVSVTKTGTATFSTVVNMSGGITAASAGSTPSPYILVAGASGAAGKFAVFRYVIPVGGSIPAWEYSWGTM